MQLLVRLEWVRPDAESHRDARAPPQPASPPARQIIPSRCGPPTGLTLGDIVLSEIAVTEGQMPLIGGT